MLQSWARLPFFCLLVSAVGLAAPGQPDVAVPPRAAEIARKDTVYLARGLAPENLLVLSAALGARDPSAVLLLDTPGSAVANRHFLNEFRPARIVPVGDHNGDLDPLLSRLGLRPEEPHYWSLRPSLGVWRELFTRADTIVVCPPAPRGLLLQAACLAGTLGAPLHVVQGQPGEAAEFRHLVKRWQISHVYALGDATLPGQARDLAVTKLHDEREIARLHRRLLTAKAPVRTLVIANPHDGKDKASLFAPWIALQRHALLVLTDKDGNDAEARIDEAIRTPGVEKADTLIVAADLDAIPTRKRPNPVKGDKDQQIEMEPATPTGDAPFSFAVGRIYHPDPGVIPLIVSRPRLLERRTGPRRALMVSNSGGGLPLLEAISRQTVRELHNSGFHTTAYFGKEVNRAEMRRQMPLHDVVVWEGHHNQLIHDWSFPSWEEPLPPGLIFLQSCLMLKEWKIEPLFRRGAVGVIGSSTRTYSASGGATSLAFFDAVIHEDRPLGEALRQSKNFMLAYYLLKQKRLDDTKKAGASLRAAWAFTLWGDPTVKLPRPEGEPPPYDAVRPRVRGNTIAFELPPRKLDGVRSDKYRAEAFPNSRLAGLLGKEQEAGKTLQPMVFAEVELPNVPDGKKPHLSSKLPARNWVFTWDGRLKRGYLLAVPRSKNPEELSFVYRWDDERVMSYAEE